MTCDEYLWHLSQRIDAENKKEEASVQKSINNLKRHLDNWTAADEIREHHEFGSYVRGTKLPSCIDPSTDVDYMVVFKSTQLKPESYMEKIRRFANTYYSKSEIHKDHPTMVIELEKLKFEITPAIELYGSRYPGYHIPAPQNLALQWIETYPEQMEIDLKKAEGLNNNLLRPLIQLIKYWNVLNGKSLTSYKIEHNCTSLVFLGEKTLFNYFIHAAEWVTLNQFLKPDEKKNSEELKKNIEIIKNYHKQGKESLALLFLQYVLPKI